MSSLEKAPCSCVKVAVIVAVVCCGATYGIVEYRHRPGNESAAMGVAPTPAEISAAERAVMPEEKRRLKAKEHYLAGLKYLQDGRYELARTEFRKGKELDPADSDIKAGLAHVEKLLAP
ncbi:MAG TPA: hypothetical protein DCZ92_09295 [Elusimicrobia bacterium]|nr:MAG: hypothetical protein A2016_05730 [Elusimicrobia bacterium GWF2_62_30]HBA60998.1 hypothetical protein [Elusimicrobiota bacterium]